ncbi:MAG: hypothetical protein AAGC97_12925 [Planctomycetota bacterium]
MLTELVKARIDALMMSGIVLLAVSASLTQLVRVQKEQETQTIQWINDHVDQIAAAIRDQLKI